MNLKALFLATAVALCGCAQTLNLDSALTAVPYDLQGNGRILVDVRINDRGPLPFALDSGASISLIFDEARGDLALETLPAASATIHGMVASGRFPLVRIDRLQVGGEIWSDARVVSAPGATDAASGIAGILGVDFLRRYGVAFSTRDRLVRLYRPEVVSERAYRGWASVPLDPVNVGASSEPLYFFDSQIGGRTVPALFDLGAGVNLLNPPGARLLGLALPRGGQDAVLADVLENARVIARFESERVTTAGIGWQNEEFMIVDADIFATLMRRDSPLAIIGAGLFNQRDFVIDFVRNRLLVRISMNEVDELP